MQCCKKSSASDDEKITPLSSKASECLARCVFPPCLCGPVQVPPGADGQNSLVSPPGVQDMIVEGLSDMLVWRGPGSLAGTELRVADCKNCTIILLDNVSTITVDSCTTCDIILVASSQSAFLRSSIDCRFAVSSGQLRTRDLTRCTIFLHCNTDPIIESSDNLIFMPFGLRVDLPTPADSQDQDPKLNEDIVYYIHYAIHSAQARSSLVGLKNRFENVYNFTPDHNTYQVLLQPTSAQKEIEKPPIIRFPSTFKSLASDTHVLRRCSERRGEVSGRALAVISGGVVHGMLKPASKALASIFGDETCYFWIEGINTNLSAQEYSRQYTQASMWWSSQLYGLFYAHKLHIRQVAAVLPGAAKYTNATANISTGHGFIVSVSSASNTLPNLIEVTHKFQACGLTLPPIKILSGAEIQHAKELVSRWNREMQLS